MTFNMPPWHPITSPIDLKHLGKLAEELGELTAAISRCIIQGLDEREPVTGKLNREWLEDEIADVAVGIDLCIEHFRLNGPRMAERANQKEARLRSWHGALKQAPPPSQT